MKTTLKAAMPIIKQTLKEDLKMTGKEVLMQSAIGARNSTADFAKKSVETIFDTFLGSEMEVK